MNLPSEGNVKRVIAIHFVLQKKSENYYFYIAATMMFFYFLF